MQDLTEENLGLVLGQKANAGTSSKISTPSARSLPFIPYHPYEAANAPLQTVTEEQLEGNDEDATDERQSFLTTTIHADEAAGRV